MNRSIRSAKTKKDPCPKDKDPQKVLIHLMMVEIPAANVGGLDCFVNQLGRGAVEMQLENKNPIKVSGCEANPSPGYKLDMGSF